MVWQRHLLHGFLAVLLCFQPTLSLTTNPKQSNGRKDPLESISSSGYHTSNFGARQNHPTSYDPSPPFLGPLCLEKEDGYRKTFYNTGRERIQHYFQRLDIPLASSSTAILKESSPTKQKLKAIVDHLALHNAPVDVKEVCESIEFLLRTRKRLLGAAKQRSSSTTGSSVNLYDLCCGHGLTGMLFACCGIGKASGNNNNNSQPQLNVILVDQKQPPSHSILLELLGQVCPWILREDAVTFREASLDSCTTALLSDLSCCDDNQNDYATTTTQLVISTHACGGLTDRVLELGTNSRSAAVAVMPCCYTGTSQGTPYGIQRALGVAWAADIDRSFRLQAQGYHSDFATIPNEITPMNRILLGELRGKD